MNFKHSVLIIDDKESIRELIRTVLERRGYEVAAVGNGLEGIDYAVSHQPSLILLDYYMGGINGEEVLQHLRSEPVTADIPVVFVTADKDAIAEQGKKAAQGFLIKPFDIHHLENLVDRWLNRDAG